MKTLHIIPHSHWDREWYQPFEGHRIKLVELFDAIIEEMENDRNYTFYHFDGQFIPVEDYLEIRPAMRERLLKLIRDGRIQIGPWYVLQDEYLTSGEANIRNMLYGIELCKSIGAEPVMTGYFPDSFGNVSQAPQICAGFGIDNAVFGRGLNNLGTQDPEIRAKGITNSELIWRSPDGSEVIGVMFVNWYSNANELPRDREALKTRIEQIVGGLEPFSVTDHLLGMNGCDHQPLERGLSEVIKTANEVQDKVWVKQSNFKDYMAEIRKYRDKFKVFEGEIAGQYNDGYCLLTNTASTHIDVKQKNHQNQATLERICEPLSSVATLFGYKYPSDLLLYAWRKLMQNHPHDSICTCSCDEVYREMLTRFEKSQVVADRLTDEAVEFLANKIDTTGGEKAIVVFSQEPRKQTSIVKCHVDFDRDESLTDITVKNENGKIIPISYRIIRNQFIYTLPKDTFRTSKYVDRFEITMQVETDGIGYSVYTVTRGKSEYSNAVKLSENTLESSTLKVEFNKNGSFTLTDKRSGEIYENQNLLIDEADAGDSYNFIKGERATKIADCAKLEAGEITPFSATMICKIRLSDEEDVVSKVTLIEGCDRVDIETTIQNRGDNHRIRATFESDVDTSVAMAEGQFDLIERDIIPAKVWKNPSYDRKMQAFVTLESNRRSLAVAGRGLYEYEISQDASHTINLTLLRCVGQIGDWGVFPTPDAQCHGNFTLNYSVVPYSKRADSSAYSECYAFSYPSVIAYGTDSHAGELGKYARFVSLDNDFIRLSAFKKAEYSDKLILRLFNISDKEQTVNIALGGDFKTASLVGLDEEFRAPLSINDGILNLTFGKKKIVTVALSI